MDNVKWTTLGAKLFCLGFAVIALCISLRYLPGIALPFLIAYLIASAVRPSAHVIASRTKMSYKFWAFLFITLLLGLVVVAAGSAINRLIYEIGRLIAALREDGAVIKKVSDMIRSIEAALPLDGEGEFSALFNQRVRELISRLVDGVISSLTSVLPGMLADLAGRTPSFIISVTVTVISCYYIALDDGKLGREALMLLPSRSHERFLSLRGSIGQTAAIYLKAYALILFITFCELFIGISLLRIEYAFIIACLIAVIDILPVLGVGTVLIPWSVVSFIMSDTRRGIGLLVLYLVITLVRQLVEPRVLGRRLGLHPLLTLFAMYAGFSLFGFIGMILAPAVALIIKATISSRSSINAPASQCEAL